MNEWVAPGSRTDVSRLQMGNDATRRRRRPRLPSGDGKRQSQVDRGQGTIEFMGMVPLVLAVLVAALQVMILGYTAHAASQAARDGARAYSLDQSAVAAAQASLPGAISLVNVSTFGPDHGVRVTVEAPPMLFLLDRQVTRTVTMP
jgi:hypothetical protein